MFPDFHYSSELSCPTLARSRTWNPARYEYGLCIRYRSNLGHHLEFERTEKIEVKVNLV